VIALCILIFFTIFLIIFSILLHHKLLNPPVIFLGIWSFILIIYSFNLSHHQDQLSIKTVQYLAAIFASFFIGYFYFYIFFLKKYRNRELVKPSGYLKIGFNERFLDISFFIILFLLLLEIVYSKGVPLFWLIKDIPKNYFEFGIPSFHGLLMSYILFYGTILYISIKIQFKKRFLVYFILIILSMVLLVTRQNLVILFVQILLAQHYLIKRINVLKLIPVVLICVILFGLIGNFRTGLDVFVKVADIKNQNLSQFESGFYWVYMYLTMTIANINKLFNMGFEYFKGINMLQEVLPTVIIESFYNYNINPNARFWLVNPNFTVSGYMAAPYLDFGIYGVIIYTFILGGLSCLIYHKYLFRISFRNSFLYIILLQIIMMSFFTDYLLYLPVSFQFFWTIVLSKKVCRYGDC
jgi:oligosaccharide repeat unit polymerase